MYRFFLTNNKRSRGMIFFKILVLMAFLVSPAFGQSSSLNCGLKPLPKLRYKIGRCINGQWEQVSKRTSSSLNCGLKPLPKLGYKIGRCINGQWEQVSKRTSSSLNCGLKPLPKLGYKIGRCINGQWEQVSN